MWSPRVTRADVAALAGVSGTTVSFVLNRTPGQRIPEATRARVLTAVRDLGYEPHLGARSMGRGKNDLIVLLVPRMTGSHSLADYTEHFASEAGHRGHAVALLHTSVDPQTLLRTLRLLSPSSIASIGAVPQFVLDLASAAQIPVAIGDRLVGSDAPQSTAGLAREEVGSVQIEYLASRGHEHIAYLLPDDPSLQDFSSHRFAGAREAQHSLDLPRLRSARAPISRRRLTEIAGKWVKSGITAVCAYNDDWALSLLGCMHDLGLRAPDDLAVIGVDDVPAAEFSIPPLTTLRHDMAVFAKRSIAVLDQAAGRAIDVPDPGMPFSTLVQRKSA
jgi:DNA-binding LacI/PurR family transcriptional regulator